MIVYTCHQCKAQLQSPDSMSGSFITCPGCKSTLIVPGAPYRPTGPATTTADAPAVAMTQAGAGAAEPANTQPSSVGFGGAGVKVPFDGSASAVPPPVPGGAGVGGLGGGGVGVGVGGVAVPPMPPAWNAGLAGDGQPARVSRLIYVLLAIFLGWVGVHNFAAGRNGTAVVQLVTGLAGLLLSPCTFGLTLVAPFATFVWGIVDAVTQTRDGDGRVMP